VIEAIRQEWILIDLSVVYAYLNDFLVAVKEFEGLLNFNRDVC
jgi:hypothetical protein